MLVLSFKAALLIGKSFRKVVVNGPAIKSENASTWCKGVWARTTPHIGIEILSLKNKRQETALKKDGQDANKEEFLIPSFL